MAEKLGDVWSTAPEDIRAALERAAEVEEEYGVWIATETIPVPFGTAPAYHRGTPIPVSNVERWHYNEDDAGWPAHKVAVERDSDEGREILAELAAKAGVSSDPASMAEMLNDVQTTTAARRAAAKEGKSTKDGPSGASTKGATGGDA